MAARILLQRVRSLLALQLPQLLYSRAPSLANNPLQFLQQAAPLTAALLVAGVAFTPRVAHAEAPESYNSVWIMRGPLSTRLVASFH